MRARHLPALPEPSGPCPWTKPFLQAAAYAEFRGDWPEALRCYRSAYASLDKLGAPSHPAPLQRWAEVLAAAELLSLKVCVRAWACASGSCLRSCVACTPVRHTLTQAPPSPSLANIKLQIHKPVNM